MRVLQAKSRADHGLALAESVSVEVSHNQTFFSIPLAQNHLHRRGMMTNLVKLYLIPHNRTVSCRVHTKQMKLLDLMEFLVFLRRKETIEWSQVSHDILFHQIVKIPYKKGITTHIVTSGKIKVQKGHTANEQHE